MTVPDYADDFPTVPDRTDVSDFPHSILDPAQSDPTTDHTTMGDPHEGVVDTFYGIDHTGHPGEVDREATSLVDLTDDDELAVTQDMRWHKGLVVLSPGARSLQAQTLMLPAGSVPARITRENAMRRTVVVTNPPAPVGDGASVVWIAQTQADAKIGAGFPLVAGATVSMDYSGDVWAVSSNAAGSLVSILSPVFDENLQ